MHYFLYLYLQKHIIMNKLFSNCIKATVSACLFGITLSCAEQKKEEEKVSVGDGTLKKQELSVLGNENQFDLIGKQWMLITSGDTSKYNTMTASWGGFGHLWDKEVAFIFGRPERYTHEFIEANDRLTLSFFDEKYRQALQICGTKSGRDGDKVKEAGLTPISLESNTTTFDEARMVLDCRKLFKTEMTEAAFLDKEVRERYYNPQPGGGYHTIYVVEIENVYVK